MVRQLGAFELTAVPVPAPGPGEVLVRVAVAGLCRTDLKLIESGHRDLVLPRIPAEEVVGTVCRLGAGTDGAWLGRRVYLYPGTSCGLCPPCAAGAGNLCLTMRIMGFHRDGGFAQYVAAPAASLLELPRSLPFEQIATTRDAGQERRRFLRVLAGCGPVACEDFTCANAAAVLQCSSPERGV